MTRGRSACRAACGNMSIADAAFATAALAAALLGWLIVLWLLTVAPAFVFFLGESDRRYQHCSKQAKKSDLFFHACVSDDESHFVQIPCSERRTPLGEMHKPGWIYRLTNFFWTGHQDNGLSLDFRCNLRSHEGISRSARDA
jgi:hypothetical protein